MSETLRNKLEEAPTGQRGDNFALIKIITTLY